jgi:hypothetical protein
MMHVLVGVVLFALMSGATSAAVAANRGELPGSPVVLSVRPGSVTAGELAVVTFAVDRWTTSMPFDLHVVRSLSEIGARFLTPRGAWSTEPQPLARGVRLADVERLAVPWPSAREVGWAPVLLILTRPGTDPRLRSSWIAQPALELVPLRAALTGDLVAGGAGWVLAALGALSVGACLLVLAFGRWSWVRDG